MTAHDQSSSSDIVDGSLPRPSVFKSMTRLRTAVVGWIGTAANYYAAAALYEQLSGLSDSELKRRGLSRANLAHDVLAACDDVGSSGSTVSPMDSMLRTGPNRRHVQICQDPPDSARPAQLPPGGQLLGDGTAAPAKMTAWLRSMSRWVKSVCGWSVAGTSGHSSS